MCLNGRGYRGEGVLLPAPLPAPVWCAVLRRLRRARAAHVPCLRRACAAPALPPALIFHHPGPQAETGDGRLGRCAATCAGPALTCATACASAGPAPSPAPACAASAPWPHMQTAPACATSTLPGGDAGWAPCAVHFTAQAPQYKSFTWGAPQ